MSAMNEVEGKKNCTLEGDVKIKKREEKKLELFFGRKRKSL